MFLPIWNECRRCSRLPTCGDPFPSSGQCPHPGDHDLGLPHPYQVDPHVSHRYCHALEVDAQLGSLFRRWRCGLRLSSADFLYLREKALQASAGFLAPAPMELLFDVLHVHLERLGTNFITYYQPPAPRLIDAIRQGLAFAVLTAQPTVLAGTIEQGADWARHVLDVVRCWVWLDLRIGYLDTRDMGDEAFRALFEREWWALMAYRGDLYDFRVIPRLSLDDFVRYQKLPRGNPEIRQAISTYLVHQAKEYPHVFKPWFENIADLAFGRRLRTMYTPLVEAVVREALRNLEVTGQARAPIREDLRKELWRVYDQNWTQFQFYWSYRGKERPFGCRGFVGFAESPRARELFDQLIRELGLKYRSQDLSEVAFAHHINQRLRRWVAKRYPPDPRPPRALSLDASIGAEDDRTLGETLADAGGWSVDPDAYLHEEPACTGPDGTPYLTIEQAVREYGVSEHQLRRWDKNGSYPVQRAHDIFGKNGPLPPKTRLYPATPEAYTQIQIALLRAKMHSSHLEGEELNRKQAAAALRVPESTLRYWEREGRLQPVRKGRAVVYTAENLKQAEGLIKQDR